jgi:hypothetical protein
MCPHTTINVSAINVSLYVSHTTVCVLILLNMWCMCPLTSTYVVLGAFDAWLLMRGMRTLFVRVERQCQVLRDAAINVSAYAAINVSLCAVRKGRAPVTGTRLDAAIRCCYKCVRILLYVASYCYISSVGILLYVSSHYYIYVLVLPHRLLLHI